MLLASLLVDSFAADFDAGLRAARRKEAYVRTYGRDRQTLGTWWSGHRRESTEWVLRLTPQFAARWLAYWDWLEVWPEAERTRRWKGFVEETQGATHFFVLLSAYPKASTLDLIEPAGADTRHLDRLRFLVTVDGKRIPLEVEEIDRRRVRDADDIQNYRWWRRIPVASWLAPDTLSDPDDPMFALGEFHGAYYHVWTTQPLPSSFKFEVIGQRKSRSTEFREPK